jgi:hypothetical protein
MTQLLIAVEQASGRFGPSLPSMQLRAYIESRLWLKAMGEPQPHRPATLHEVAETHWLGDLDALRKRGVAKTFQLRTLAIWSDTDPVPPFTAAADNEIPGENWFTPSPYPNEANLFARYAIVNVGHEPVSGLRLQFSGPNSPLTTGGTELRDCRWRPFDPLQPGETREFLCTFTVPRTLVDGWHSSIESQSRPEGVSVGNLLVFQDVSFREAGHNIPYIPYRLDVPPTDPEIARIVATEAYSECSSVDQRQSVVIWVVLAALFGAVVGWVFTR